MQIRLPVLLLLVACETSDSSVMDASTGDAALSDAGYDSSIADASDAQADGDSALSDAGDDSSIADASDAQTDADLFDVCGAYDESAACTADVRCQEVHAQPTEDDGGPGDFVFIACLPENGGCIGDGDVPTCASDVDGGTPYLFPSRCFPVYWVERDRDDCAYSN